MTETDWIGIIIPIFVFTLFFSFSSFVIIKAFYNGWTKKYKFVFKYKIFRRPYHEGIVKGCLGYMKDNLSYSDLKKYLMVKSVPKYLMNEILWIYNELLKQLKGGNNHERKIKGIGNEVTTGQDLPKYSSTDIPKD